MGGGWGGGQVFYFAGHSVRAAEGGGDGPVFSFSDISAHIHLVSIPWLTSESHCIGFWNKRNIQKM